MSLNSCCRLSDTKLFYPPEPTRSFSLNLSSVSANAGIFYVRPSAWPAAMSLNTNATIFIIKNNTLFY